MPRAAPAAVVALASASAALAILAVAGAASAAYEFESADWGVEFLHAGNRGAGPAYPEVNGSGACVLDYDGDGWEDLFLVNARYWNATTQARMVPRSALYRNSEGTGFVKVAGTLDVVAWGMGCAVGDYDADGDPDVALNTGGGAFANATAAAGLRDDACGATACFGASLAFFDYDRDADLDFYVTNYVAWDGTGPATPMMYDGQCNVLYRNEGDGTFTDATSAAGAEDCGLNHMGLAIADVDRDGWSDVFIASDETRDTLLMNNGNGTFADATTAAGVGDPRGGMGTAWGDYDGDGLLDLVITHYENEGAALYRQRAGLTFTDRRAADGLDATIPLVGWGVEFVDVDDDADLDLVVANGHASADYAAESPSGFGQLDLVLRNDGGVFVDASAGAWRPEATRRVGRGLAVADFDRDGYRDLVVVNNANESADLWRSAGGPNNWVTVRLRGNASMERDALGARVTATFGGRTVEREVMAASGFMSQGTREVHVGLGDATAVEDLSVRWPDGTVQAFGDVAANRALSLVAGGAITSIAERALARVRDAAITADRVAAVALVGEPLRAPGGVLGESWTVDGETVAGRNASWTFATLGEHRATYRVESASGGADEAVAIVTVVNLPPVAAIDGPTAAGRVDAARFRGGRSSDSDGRVVSWTWTIEGRTYASDTAVHRFAGVGDVPVRLDVTDSDGATATATLVVSVANAPPVAAAGPDASGNRWSTFAFDARASRDPDGTIVRYRWDFGDGTSAEGRRAEKRYAADGRYEVRLRVEDDLGATAEDALVVTVADGNAPPVADGGPDREATRLDDVAFDATASYDPDGRITSYLWDFGDGTTAEGSTSVHRYRSLGAFDATLTVTDDNSTTTTARVRVTVVNVAPRVSAGPDLAREGLSPVAFAAEGEDPDGVIAVWRWSFGDGSESAGREATHAYAAYGRHLATVTATDDDGAAAMASRRLWLFARPVAEPGPDREADRLTTLTFDGRASSDADGRVVAYRWEFGDGASSNLAVARHRFATLGAHALRLTVTDDDGFTGTATAVVTVRNLPPVVVFEASPIANLHQPIAYSALGTFDPDGRVAEWRWSFGDGHSCVSRDADGARAACTDHGGPAARSSATHAFSSLGAFDVRFTATDDDGAVVTAERRVPVTDVLDVSVAMARGEVAPDEPARGEVVVRFANGAPVAGADVAIAIAYVVDAPAAPGAPLAIAIAHPLPREVAQWTVKGRTASDGRLAFEAPPWTPEPVPPIAAPTGATGAEWGRYRVDAIADWRSNAGDGATAYAVRPRAEVPP